MPQSAAGRGKGFPCCPWSGPAPALGPMFTACFGVARTLPGLQRDRQLASPSSLCGLHGSCGVREPRAPGHPLHGGRCEALPLSGADGGGGGHPISAGTSTPQGLCTQRSLSHGHSGMGTALGSCIPLSTRIPPGAGAPIAVPSWWRCPSNPSELPPGGNCSSSPELVFAPTPPCKPAPASPSPACLPFLTGRRRRRRRRRLRARSGRSKERAWEPGERGTAAQRDGTGQDGRAQLSLPPGTAWGGQQQPRAGGFAPCTLIQHRPHVSVCSASSASHGGTQELSPAAGSCLRAGCWGCCGHLGDPAAVPRGAVAMRRARGRGAAVPRAGQRGHNCPVGPRGWGHQGMGAGRGRWHPEMPQRGLAMPVMPPEISR